MIYSGKERDITAAGEDRRQVSLSFQERRLFYSDSATGTGSRWCFCPSAHSCSSPISTATCLPHCFLIPLLHLILDPLWFSAKGEYENGKDRHRQTGKQTDGSRQTGGRSSLRAPGNHNNRSICGFGYLYAPTLFHTVMTGLYRSSNSTPDVNHLPTSSASSAQPNTPNGNFVPRFDQAPLTTFFVGSEGGANMTPNSKPSRVRRKSAPGSETVKHRRTRSGCFTCRTRRVKVIKKSKPDRS